MTVGENIRRIRKERGLTQKQLGELVGASEAYIRAYESGRRNPKPSSLEKIANALAVNPEVLENSDFDMIKAMHRLFQIARQYNGHLFACKDDEGNDTVGIRFETLTLMNAWCQRYEKFLEDVEKCNEIKDAKNVGKLSLKPKRIMTAGWTLTPNKTEILFSTSVSSSSTTKLWRIQNTV